MICTGSENDKVIHMVFPHQDLSDDLRDVAERMTTATDLAYLGFEPEGGFEI